MYPPGFAGEPVRTKETGNLLSQPDQFSSAPGFVLFRNFALEIED